jgi:hypothetical protein
MLDIEKFPHLIDPRIGVLIREGREVYYAHVDGEFPVRDTVDEVLELLGVVSAQPAARGVPRREPTDLLPSGEEGYLTAREKIGGRGEWRTYEVKVKNLDISWEPEGSFMVKAKSKRTALSRAREEMRSYGHGRRDGRLRFTVAEDE